MHAIRLYSRLILVRLQSMMEYRSMFLFGAVMQACGYGALALLLWIVVDHFGGIGQWTAYEITLIWGMNIFCYAVAGIFCLHSFYLLGATIRTGEFDNVLTKPLNPFFFMAFRQFNYGYFSHITVALSALVLSWAKLGIPVNAVNITFLLVTLFSGILIHMSVFVATGVPAFWTVRNESLAALIMWDIGDFTRYPVTIYPKAIQILLTCILPYAFVNFYPAQFFLQKDDFSIFHPVLQYCSPLVGIVMIVLAYRWWLFGLKHYQSTGS